MGFFSSGNETVDRIGKINITGNIVPDIWYEMLRTEGNRPYYLAIALLAEIVYWYRPTEVRDEKTGQVLGWKKKFKDFALQRDYIDFVEHYGEEKKTIQRALEYLESKNLIKRDPRDIKDARGRKIPNVLYIHLNANALFKLTYPDDADIPKEFKEKVEKIRNPKSEKQTEDSISYGQECTNGMDSSVQTIWTEESIPYGHEIPDYIDRGFQTVRTENSVPYGQQKSEHTDSSVQTNTYTTYPNTMNIDSTQLNSLSEREETIRELLEDAIDEDYIYNELPNVTPEMMAKVFDVMTDVLLMDDHQLIRVNRENIPAKRVKNRFLSLTSNDLCFMFTQVLDSKGGRPSRRNYLITTLYNAVGNGDFAFRDFFNETQQRYEEKRDNLSHF